MNDFDFEKYLASGVENIVKDIYKATLLNPKATLFMKKYLTVCKKSNKKRMELQKQGKHIPPFLIASVTTDCNLHCRGCYARANHNCFDKNEDNTNPMLSSNRWNSIFDEAQDLGINFIIMVGGEPMLRQSVLKSAGAHQKILFPVFTNGTLLQDESILLFNTYPNLFPVLSIEGNQETTDKRRGKGTYQTLQNGMKKLSKKAIPFGCSITVTKDNLDDVMSESYIDELKDNGCKAIVYVEYVPVKKETIDLAPDDQTREIMMERLKILRNKYSKLLFISFPGDEKASEGCLAAGRGFFHINAFGNVEPCPFSAHSDTNLQDHSILEALESPLFLKIKDSGAMSNEHIGGCVLFEQDELVSKLSEENINDN
ncbi:MAG: radical SAM protein [Thomasclavelia sp.]|nr:radical SAM protein [Thomasclavelia sp.]